MDPGLIFGLGSAAAFGGGDFTGGLATRRANGPLVAAGAQAIGLVCLVALLVVLWPGPPPLLAILIGAVAGVMGGIGLAALYRGLAAGSMGVVAALSAVGSVVLPLLVTAAFGKALGPLQWVGIAAALGAGLAASGATLSGVPTTALRLAAVAAVGFGLWYVFLDLGAEHNELWTLVASRASATIVIGSFALARGSARQLGAVWPLIVVAGALDVTGNAAFVLARGEVPVGVAAALSGLYPIVTMLLARVVLREALPPLGLLAVLMAVLGIVLISVG
jgi:drug/metabolite transporter (DMT)-like permease